jgi:effector-binding domain-containing protein
MADSMRALFEAAEGLGLQPAGAPFALFFDDPGRVPVAELRARACLPVLEPPARKHGLLEYDVLPRAMVVYARVQGAYPEAARIYPALFSYLRDLGWRQGGPVREVYLVDPLQASRDGEFLTEVQIPWVATTQ